MRSRSGPIAHAELEQACSPQAGVLRLDTSDALDILQAAGLVRVIGSWRVDPVDVRPVSSLLSLPRRAAEAPDLVAQLRRDLTDLLERMHATAADFFRPGTDGKGKRLVPEAVFAAYLGLGFSLLGWQVEREAQHGAGRTDVPRGAAGSQRP